jgi:hypothetical protein
MKSDEDRIELLGIFHLLFHLTWADNQGILSLLVAGHIPVPRGARNPDEPLYLALDR